MKHLLRNKPNPALKLWTTRIVALVLMVLLAVAAMLYAAGVYDLSFVARPEETPEQTEGTQSGTAGQTEKTEETTEPWTEKNLRADTEGASVSLDAFLASLPKKTGGATDEYENGKTSFSLVAIDAQSAYSLSERAITVLTKTVDMVNSYKTEIGAGTEARPLLEAVSGHLVLDRGDGTYTLFDRAGKTVLDKLSFADTKVTGLTDAKGRAIVLNQGAYFVLDGKTLNADAAATANIGQRSSCIGQTGAADDITIFAENELYGYQKADGTKLTTACFTRAFPFSDGYAVAFNAQAMYIVNDAGDIMHGEPYTVSSDWQTNVKLTMPDTEGIESLGHFYFDHGLMRVRYRINYNLYDGYYDVKLSDDEVLMDAVGNVINPPSGYEMLSYHDGIAVLRQTASGFCGMMNATGKWITPPVYSDTRACVSGLIPVEYGGKWGLLDKTGAFAVPPVFDAPPSISEGLIAAHSAENGWIVLSIEKK